MAQPADFTEEQLPEGGTALHFSGTLSIAHIGDLDQRLRAVASTVSQIDISQIDHIDTVGAWLVYRTAQKHDAKITNADKDAARLIDEA